MLDYNNCILKLRKQVKRTESNGLSVVIKHVPESEDQGVLDPRQALRVEKNLMNTPVSIKDCHNPTISEIESIRAAMGCVNTDLSKNISIEESVFDGVNVEIYRLKNLSGINPVTVYIHGGGFIGGSLRVVRNSCKLLAERSNSTVVSIDYSLAPEHRFPSALYECNKVIEFILSNQEKLNMDGSRLIIMGDSAGANLAAACCLLDKKRKISLQVLLYPLMNIDPDNPDWAEKDYCIKENPEMAQYLIHEIKPLVELSTYCYINGKEDLKNPLTSPLLFSDPSAFPTTLIVSPEYDYLRNQAEQFANLLSESGVDVISYQYRGMGHAFFEHTGEFPQVEDCINEIAAAIMAM